MSKTYKVELEVRYYATNYDNEKRCRTVKNLIGVYTEQIQAINAGNEALKKLEKLFPTHVFPNGEAAPISRLSQRENIVSELAYLKTPFSFFMKIEATFNNSVEDFVKGILVDLE